MLFQTKPEQIEAYQLGEVTFGGMRNGNDLFENQPEWISDLIDGRQIQVSQVSASNYMCLEWTYEEELVRVMPGDWLGRDGAGFFFKLTPHDLATEFDRVEEPKPAKKTAAKKTAAKK